MIPKIGNRFSDKIVRKQETRSRVVMPTHRSALLHAPHPVLGYGHLRFQSANPKPKWTIFMAGLWSCRLMEAIRLTAHRAALGAMLLAMPGCSQIALPDSAQP